MKGQLRLSFELDEGLFESGRDSALPEFLKIELCWLDASVSQKKWFLTIRPPSFWPQYRKYPHLSKDWLLILLWQMNTSSQEPVLMYSFLLCKVWAWDMEFPRWWFWWLHIQKFPWHLDYLGMVLNSIGTVAWTLWSNVTLTTAKRWATCNNAASFIIPR